MSKFKPWMTFDLNRESTPASPNPVKTRLRKNLSNIGNLLNWIDSDYRYTDEELVLCQIIFRKLIIFANFWDNKLCFKAMD